MTDRATHNLRGRHDAEDRQRAGRGVAVIADSPDARFLFRAFLLEMGALENCGMGINPFAGNALTTAHETGKMAATQRLMSLMEEHVPSFYADLIKEHTDEYNARLEQYAAVERAARERSDD